MSKRIQVTETTDDEEDQDLRNLLEKYIRRSEELEQRESKVMKQIEMMQSAVSSLQEWNQSRKSSVVSQESVRLDLKEIEEETKSIREETKRIQMEVKQKQEENRKLQEEVNKRKRLQSAPDDSYPTDNWKKLDSRTEKTSTVIRAMRDSDSQDPNSQRGVDFFDEKLEKLREAERRLKMESEQQLEEARKKQKQQRETLEMLEWESRINKQLLESLRKKAVKK